MKQEVREIANKAGLPSARRKDSQGICFLGKIHYNDFVRRFLGEKKGAIIELETGKKLGTHRGYWFHTIGPVSYTHLLLDFRQVTKDIFIVLAFCFRIQSHIIDPSKSQYRQLVLFVKPGFQFELRIGGEMIIY